MSRDFGVALPHDAPGLMLLTDIISEHAPVKERVTKAKCMLILTATADALFSTKKYAF